MPQILIFGASITYGAWDVEGGWAQRLRKFLDKKCLSDGSCSFVYNLGIPGDTTEELLKRFKSETESRLEEKEEKIFIFSIGVNDSSFVDSKNSSWISAGKFRENLQSLINSARQFSGKLVFVGLTPIDESKTTPIPWRPDISYKNDSIFEYNEIIKKICEENSLPFVEVYEQLKGSENLSEDGLHPNSKGHKKIFEIVKDFLIVNKILSIE